ncbi:MAG: PqqD family protein [Candidatus Helarchaeota archaeon]
MLKLKEDIDIEEKEAYISRDAGAVLIDYETSKFYETNGTGTRILQLLQASKTKEEIIASFCDEYDVDQATFSKDLDDFLAKLRKYDLIVE